MCRRQAPGPHRIGTAATAERMKLFATLMARAAKHLLVLLLPHALAALLDERSHKARHAIGQTANPDTRQRRSATGPSGATVMVLAGVSGPVTVRGRSMVGQRFLVPSMGVRILSPEQ